MMTADRAADAKSPRRVSSDVDLALELRKRWDEYLAPLNQPDAGERLRKIFRAPIDLGGKVLAGKTY